MLFLVLDSDAFLHCFGKVTPSEYASSLGKWPTTRVGGVAAGGWRRIKHRARIHSVEPREREVLAMPAAYNPEDTAQGSAARLRGLHFAPASLACFDARLSADAPVVGPLVSLVCTYSSLICSSDALRTVVLVSLSSKPYICLRTS